MTRHDYRSPCLQQTRHKTLRRHLRKQEQPICGCKSLMRSFWGAPLSYLYLSQLLWLLHQKFLVDIHANRGEFSVSTQDAVSPGRQGCTRWKKKSEDFSPRFIQFLKHNSQKQTSTQRPQKHAVMRNIFTAFAFSTLCVVRATKLTCFSTKFDTRQPIITIWTIYIHHKYMVYTFLCTHHFRK